MNPKQKFIAYLNFYLYHLTFTDIESIIKDKWYKLKTKVSDIDIFTENDIIF